MGEKIDYQITDGDPRELMFLQLHDIARMPDEKRPRFMLELRENALSISRFHQSQRTYVLLHGIARASGTALDFEGDWWMIAGILDTGPQFLGGEEVKSGFTAKYNTRRRQGVMTLID